MTDRTLGNKEASRPSIGKTPLKTEVTEPSELSALPKLFSNHGKLVRGRSLERLKSGEVQVSKAYIMIRRRGNAALDREIFKSAAEFLLSHGIAFSTGRNSSVETYTPLLVTVDSAMLGTVLQQDWCNGLISPNLRAESRVARATSLSSISSTSRLQVSERTLGMPSGLLNTLADGGTSNVIVAFHKTHLDEKKDEIKDVVTLCAGGEKELQPFSDMTTIDVDYPSLLALLSYPFVSTVAGNGAIVLVQ